ncbi:MAG: PBP1A family penicillin-binding protein [Pseudomonadota bacterium]
MSKPRSTPPSGKRSTKTADLKGRIEPHFEASATHGAGSKAKKAKATGRTAKVASSKGKRAAKTRSRSSSWLGRFVSKTAYWGLVAGLWATIAVGGVFLFYAAQLPSASTWKVPERPPNVRILAEDGSLIANRGLTGGKALRLEDMSPYIPQAVIAIEDRRFHAHWGFDVIGFSRAMVRNIQQRRLREGGSTLTQQLAKNLFLTPERTFGRKIQELILAFWLESKYSKAEILELYLNRVYFGAGATGVDAASRRYFGKSAKHVTIEEAALLAGLLKAPSRFTPARSPKRANRRAAVVLAAMEREGYIKPNRARKGLYQPGENARYFNAGPENFVADMVLKRVRAKIGDIKQDIVVRTTISPFLMTVADAAIKGPLQAKGKTHRVRQAALVSLAPDGAIKSLIGGANYAASQFNRAVDAKRQPGSAFKPFVWQAALQAGYSADSVVADQPVRIGKWQPANYDGRYRGSVTLEQALAKSLNTVSARLTQRVGVSSVVATARAMGISAPLQRNASLSLGTSEVSLLELTAAYLPYANGGQRRTPYVISSIKTANKKTLYRHRAGIAVSVLDATTLSEMNQMMVSVVERGTAKAARLEDHVAAGKTGTSQAFRDALFVGHTAHFVTGVWFGNDDNRPTKKLTGGGLPAQSWKTYMATAHRGLAAKPLPGLDAGAQRGVPFLPAKVAVPTARPRPGGIAEGGVADAQDAALRTRMDRAMRRGSDGGSQGNRDHRRGILDILLGR